MILLHRGRETHGRTVTGNRGFQKKAMRAILLLFLVALVVSDELPRKYMALRGFDIEGNDIKDTGNKNVRIGETVNG